MDSRMLLFRSLINYGLMAPWIFIGSSTFIIGVWLLLVQKFGIGLVKKQTAVGAKEAACLRETAFVTVKPANKLSPPASIPPIPPMKVKPPNSISGMHQQTQSIQQWQTSPLKREKPPPPLKSTLDLHFSEIRGNCQNSLPPPRPPPTVAISSQIVQESPLDKPLPPLPEGGGSVYLCASGGPDIDIVPRRRAPPPPPPADFLPVQNAQLEPLTGNVSKLKGLFES